MVERTRWFRSMARVTMEVKAKVAEVVELLNFSARITGGDLFQVMILTTLVGHGMSGYLLYSMEYGVRSQ